MERKRIYYYSMGDQVLVANASSIVTIKIDSDADFEMVKILGKSTSTFSVKFTFTDPSYNLSQNRIPNINICGSYSSAYPNILKAPMIIKANSVITCDILDTSSAGNTIDIVFEGYKVFRN